MGGLSPAPAPAPAPSYAAGLAAAAAGVGAFALAALAWPCALLAALVAGPGPLRTLRCELNDRWWWGAYGLGATPAERRTSFLLKAQVFVLARLPWAVLRRFDGRMAAFGFTSKTWEAQKAMDRMPTVKRGLEALGMTSVMEWKYRPHEISLTPSPWTHEALRPILFLPGLRAQPFYSADRFAWVRALEAAHPVIQAELDAARADVGFAPYLTPEGKSENTVREWSTMFFVTPHGKQVQPNIDKCPRTWKILSSIPGFVPSNMCMFSALQPGGRIRPHTGLTNACLRVHLGVHVPEPAKSVLRVGPDVGTWEEGKVLIFNDAFDHEVWNTGTKTRSVLFFDVWQ